MTHAGTQESDGPGPQGRGSGEGAVDGQLLLRIDGAAALSPEIVGQVTALCDAAEAGAGTVLLEVSGAPRTPRPGELTVGLVSKWERALRRLERSPAATIAVAASGDCGGVALDVLLAADHRIAAAGVRLVPTIRDGLVWPGMALFRLARHGANSAAVRRAVLLGRPIEAAEALALHLVHEIVPDLPGAREAAAGLAGDVPVADLALRRQLLFDAVHTGFEEALGVHLAACDRVLRQAAAPAEAASA